MSAKDKKEREKQCIKEKLWQSALCKMPCKVLQFKVSKKSSWETIFKQCLASATDNLYMGNPYPLPQHRTLPQFSSAFYFFLQTFFFFF